MALITEYFTSQTVEINVLGRSKGANVHTLADRLAEKEVETPW